MKTFALRSAAALVLGSTALLSQAATVNFNQWAYGNSWGNVVTVSDPAYSGAAGAFKGAVAFTGTEQGFSGVLSSFISYCVEIDERFTLPSGNMSGYSVVAGADYGKWNNTNGTGKMAANTATRLGQLLSYVGSNTALVDTAAESTSLQLAIWNVIYDTDTSVAGGLFAESTAGGAYNTYANTLMAASTSWNRALDVFVLQRVGSQDFVLTRDSGRLVPDGFNPNATAIPEPASLALVLLALGAAAGVGKRHAARSTGRSAA